MKKAFRIIKSAEKLKNIISKVDIDINKGGAETKKAEFLYFVIPLKNEQSRDIKNNKSLEKKIWINLVISISKLENIMSWEINKKIIKKNSIWKQKLYRQIKR